MENNKTKHNISDWLFNPFKKIAGINAMLIGLAAIAITSVFAFSYNTHFNGVIDIKYGESDLAFHGFLLYSVVNVISVSIIFFITGLIISKSKIRFIDVLGTQTLARYPLIVTPFFNATGLIEKVSNNIMYKYLNYGEPEIIKGLEMFWFIIFIFMTVVIIVWFITLMFNAYRVSCNLKGTKAVISFIIGLVLAEIISLVLNSIFVKSLLLT